MTLPLALSIIGLGLLGAAVLMWRSRKGPARRARALDEVRLAKAGEVASGDVCAVWGRALAESETLDSQTLDPVTGRSMAWWDLRVARTTPEGSKTVHAASSGGSFLVADDSGAVRVPANKVELRLSSVFVDYEGVPGPQVQRYLDTLELDAEAYAVTARHRFVPMDTNLLVVGRFVHEAGGGNGASGRGAPTVVGALDLPPLVTTTTLAAVKELEREGVRHHAMLMGRIAVIGAAFLLMAAAAALS